MSEMLAFQAVTVVCGTVIFVASLRFLSRFLELRRERARYVPPGIDGLEQRLERIEVTVEATAVEVERISEANRFMARLLADRVGPVNLVNRPERVITPH
jgi:hypothetical protein